MIHLLDWKPFSVNLDVGGGCCEDRTVYLNQLNVTNLVYDPFNRPPEHNREALERVMKHGGADSATLIDVLNVVPKLHDRRAVLRISWCLLRAGHPIYIAVGEGDKSGERKKTRNGWQENRRLSTYLPEVGKFFQILKCNTKLIVGRRRPDEKK